MDSSESVYATNEEGNRWYIFYTQPRSEKAAKKLLEYQGHNVFLPVMQELREWKNRQKKLIETPLLPNYIFVNTLRYNIYYIERNPKIVTCITYGSEPSIIQDKDILTLKNFVSLGKGVNVDCCLAVGQPVRIIKGPFKGYEGILTDQKGKCRFGIHIGSINRSISVEIDARSVIKIKTMFYGR